MFQAKLTCQFRKVVANCYKYYGMEEMLQGSKRKKDKKSSKMSPRKRNGIQLQV